MTDDRTGTRVRVHKKKMDAVASRFVIALAKNSPILAGADQGCYVDIDDTIKATHGMPNRAQATAITASRA